jgi:hypothetical protein
MCLNVLFSHKHIHTSHARLDSLQVRSLSLSLSLPACLSLYLTVPFCLVSLSVCLFSCPGHLFVSMGLSGSLVALSCLCCAVLCGVVLCCAVLSCLVLSCLVLSCLVLSLVLSCCVVLCCVVLCCLALSVSSRVVVLFGMVSLSSNLSPAISLRSVCVAACVCLHFGLLSCFSSHIFGSRRFPLSLSLSLSLYFNRHYVRMYINVYLCLSVFLFVCLSVCMCNWVSGRMEVEAKKRHCLSVSLSCLFQSSLAQFLSVCMTVSCLTECLFVCFLHKTQRNKTKSYQSRRRQRPRQDSRQARQTSGGVRVLGFG